MKYEVKNPIVLIVFKRPDTTRKVIEVIKKVAPRKIYIIGDGPKSNEDKEKCALVQDTIDKNIDWDCEVFKNFSDTNMGGPKRVPSGLDWVFEHEKQAIILEDDIIADPSFFRFCDEMLERYKDNEQIMHISGNNGRVSCKNHPYSYSFTVLARCLGWATWSRAWKKFDPKMKKWPEMKKNNKFKKLFLNEKLAMAMAQKIYEPLYLKKIKGWDYKWGFTCLSNRGLGIMPNTNMTEHIGYGEDAQHTKKKKIFNSLPSKEVMEFPLVHPKEIKICKKCEDKKYKIKHGFKSMVIKVINEILLKLKKF
jgi:hypothetical protein